MPIDATHPDTTHQGGGTNPTMSEGPLRPGLIPKRVEFPFVAPPFYRIGIQQCLHRLMPEVGQKMHKFLNVRQKRVLPAKYGFNIFARIKG